MMTQLRTSRCLRGIQLIRPPSITNMICIAAQGYRKGEYTSAQIADAFDNACAPRSPC